MSANQWKVCRDNSVERDRPGPCPQRQPEFPISVCHHKRRRTTALRAVAICMFIEKSVWMYSFAARTTRPLPTTTIQVFFSSRSFTMTGVEQRRYVLWSHVCPSRGVCNLPLWQHERPGPCSQCQHKFSVSSCYINGVELRRYVLWPHECPLTSLCLSSLVARTTWLLAMKTA